jgi:hypothetical protein
MLAITHVVGAATRETSSIRLPATRLILTIDVAARKEDTLLG